jgi:alanyl-tRNA synthetase
MNQFKDYFLGVRKDLKRATSSQKCVRTGDLDVVGKTPYHHSFFEMLGNFSFGDYFKREAIEWAWEFLTKELGISKDHLFVSVHEKDEEALRLWVDHIGIPEKLIARLDDHTNFWPADAPKLGPNGPCGPCSEIYFDQGKNYPGSRKGFWADDESGRFAEIWNLVFTQFERHADGSLPPLKAQNIDTGMGLERLACVMQGKKSNFEIDIFAPLVSHLKNRVSKSRPVSMENLNAIADHVRAAVVAISDGAHPSNESRGYVIRKLIRRSIWKGRAMNLSAPILAPMVSLIVKSLEDTYPELRQNEKSIYESISSEEARFNETLESGLEMITKLIKEAKKRKSRLLSGEEVFQLYDTFGFPDELTRTIASESGISLDEKQFLTLLDEQRKRAKKASKLADTIFASSDLNQELLKLPASQFLGYKTTKADGTVLWENFSGNNGALVLDQTPFYPEGGGQVGDVGLIEGSKFTFQVEDTQKKDLVIVHTGHLLKGKPKVKNKCKTSVDPSSREATKRNHTATHLLQSALRAVVGTHVRQVGSLVNPEKLRFDFTHGRPLTQEQIAATEKWVNEAVLESESVDAKQENYDAALKTGALAFFGDKYSDRVRTINIKGRSKELCGGTHCQNTGEIGGFLITSESSVGSGTRRLEAITGLNTILSCNRSQRASNQHPIKF